MKLISQISKRSHFHSEYIMHLCGIGSVVPSDRRYTGGKGQVWVLLEPISYKVGMLALHSVLEPSTVLTGCS